MLILTRRIGEAVRIGDKIEISVLEIRGNQVRIGISAPPDVLVLRSELAGANSTSDPSPRRDPPLRSA